MLRPAIDPAILAPLTYAELLALCPICLGNGKTGGCSHCGRVHRLDVTSPQALALKAEEQERAAEAKQAELRSSYRGRYGRGFRQARLEAH